CAHLIESGIARGLHLGAQLYISRNGRALCDRAFGQSRLGVAMSTDTVNLWMSSCKPVTAVAVCQLWERGLLDLNDHVARFIPEFGVRGKEPITVENLLTHTGGFRLAMGLKWGEPYEQAVARICNAPLEPRWVIGQTAGYHAATAWYILAELV